MAAASRTVLLCALAGTCLGHAMDSAGEEALVLLQVDASAVARGFATEAALEGQEAADGATSVFAGRNPGIADTVRDVGDAVQSGVENVTHAIAGAAHDAAQAVADAAQAVVNATGNASETGNATADSQEKEPIVLKKCLAEFIAMTIFVFIGCGSAMSVAKTAGSAWVLQVALTFGMAITALAYTVGHYSGAQINCAVTFGLVLTGEVTAAQGVGNLVAQLLGSLLGALILLCMYGPSSKDGSKDRTGSLGANGVSEHWSIVSALIGEIVGTFVLVYVVHETAVNPANSSTQHLAPLAIGFAVFLAHSVLIPVDGCSINPTRSFGPALINVINDGGDALKGLWVFWVGPLLGAAAASGVYKLMLLSAEQTASSL